MKKAIFIIKEMDCPSEKQMIKMKLSEIKYISNLDFDLPNRKLTILYDGDFSIIKKNIDSLGFGSKVIENVEAKLSKYDKNLLEITDEVKKSNDLIDKKLLWAVLIINLSFFILEVIFGFIANSMGLVADSFDMLADAVVYGLSLYAISRTIRTKKRVAGMSGILQLLLASFGFIEVIRRLIGSEAVPNSMFMIVVSIFALIANSSCLILLNKSENKEVHIQSSQIFTSNDVIANIGVIVAGILVIIFNSKMPDLIIGAIIFGIVFRGSIKILKLSK